MYTNGDLISCVAFLLTEKEKEAKVLRNKDRSLRQIRRAQLKEKKLAELKKVCP